MQCGTHTVQQGNHLFFTVSKFWRHKCLLNIRIALIVMENLTTS